MSKAESMGAGANVPVGDGALWLVRAWPAARRLRLAAPSIVGDRRAEARLAAWLRRIPGVETVVPNARSGRILVSYAAGSPLPDCFDSAPSGQRRPSRGRSAALSSGAAASELETEDWHALAVVEALRRLGSSLEGLSANEATHRLQRWGPNRLEEFGVRSRIEMLIAQVANLPTSLLLGSSAVSTLLGDLLDAGAILAVVGFNGAIGYRVERKSEDLLASWRKLEAGQARVVRQGRLQRISADDVVPGDLILVKTGDICPADARVVEAHRLACNEAPLTGESEPRAKSADAVSAVEPLADRTSMVYAGTVIAGGHGRLVVTATGRHTELAQIGKLLEGSRSPATSLQDRLGGLANRFAAVGLGAAGISAVVDRLRGKPFGQSMRNAVALGVGAIPEGLPVVSTAALVRAMQRMRERGIVVRRLSSAETLGRVSVICADKTGTLTENSMVLEVLEIDGRQVPLKEIRCAVDDVLHDEVATALAAVVLTSDVDVRNDGSGDDIVGSSTEKALVRAAVAAGLDWAELRRRYPRRVLHERGDGRHYVVSEHEGIGRDGRESVAFVKGAPEQVLELCTSDRDGKLGAPARRRLLERNAALAGQGLRVLAVAWRPLAAPTAGRAGAKKRRAVGANGSGYTLIGLVGLRDPIREGAAEAVRAAGAAGIRTLILTGDQHRTAESVARAVGLQGKALDAREVLARLEEGDTTVLDDVAVLSRIAPGEKQAIVRALQAQGHVVAMAGDGINDAPALQTADVGIAVGVRSSDLARQAADLVLENADLRSILSAVSEGRIVYDNLRTVVRYLFATNSAEMALVIGSGIVGSAESLNSRQLLWINLVSDTFPALALALEPGDPNVLDRPPAGRDDSLLTAEMQRQVMRDGALLASAGAAGWLVGGRDHAFAALLGAEIGYVAVCRQSSRPPSPRFVLLTGSSVALQCLALTLPPLRYVLGMRAVPSAGEMLAFAGGLAAPLLLSGTMYDGEVVRTGSSRASARHARRLSPAPRTKRARSGGAAPDARRRTAAAKIERKSLRR